VPVAQRVEPKTVPVEQMVGDLTQTSEQKIFAQKFVPNEPLDVALPPKQVTIELAQVVEALPERHVANPSTLATV